MRAHVLEFHRARLGILQVRDQFAKYPFLIGVRDASEVLLDERLRCYRNPGVVMKVYPLRLALRYWKWVAVHRRVHLIRYRNHRVEALVPRQIEVVFDLLQLEVIITSLDLDERLPLLAPPANDDRTVGTHLGSILGVERGFDVGFHLARRRSRSLEQRLSELRHRRHHGE